MRQDPRFPNLFVVDPPLVQHKLSHMRDATTSTRTFRELLREITLLLGYEVTRGVAAERIRFVALVASPEGVAEYQRQHPDVPMYVAALDDRLDEHAYTVPGLGDAGDRLFGTK